jgi:hypothetical protein
MEAYMSAHRLISTLAAMALFFSFAMADLTTGLVGCWKMDEGTGSSLSDETSNNLDAALARTYDWTDGKYGKSLDFGGQGYALVQNAPVLNGFGEGITISAWLYRNNADNGYRIALSREAQCDIYEHFGLGALDGKHLLIIYCNGSPAIVSGGTAPTGQWYHLVGTWDKNTARVYADGQQVAQGEKSGSFDFSDQNPLIIGGNSNNCGGDNYLNDAFNGRVDELRIYNRALSAAEVTELYNLDPSEEPADPNAVYATVKASWNANPEADVTGYKLYYQKKTNGAYEEAKALEISGRTTTETTIENKIELGSDYKLYLTAVNSSNMESDPSDPMYLNLGQGQVRTSDGAVYVGMSALPVFMTYTNGIGKVFVTIAGNEPTPVTVSVQDLSGKTMKKLQKKIRGAGTHAIPLGNARPFASGRYLVRVDIGTEASSAAVAFTVSH